MAESRCPQFKSLKREDWEGYLIRLNLHFKCLKVKEDDMKMAAFVSNMGDQFYKLAERVMTQALSKKVGDCTYAELTKELTKYFKPTENVNTCKNLFFHREKKSTATVDQYADALTELAHKCGFTAEVRKVILRDRFLTGLSDAKMQTILFALDPTPDFDELLTKARLQEHILLDVDEVNKGANASMDSSGNVNSVSKLTTGKKTFSNRNGNSSKPSNDKGSNNGGKGGGSSNNQSQDKPCYRCLGKGHEPNSCWTRDQKCFNCQSIGHIGKACKKKPKAVRNVSDKNQGEGDVSDYESDEGSSKYVRDEYCFAIRNIDPRQPILMKFELNGVICDLEMDSGSCNTLINSDYWNRIFQNDLKCKPEVDSNKLPVLRDYNGETIPILGVATVFVVNRGQKCLLPIIIATKGPNIVGKDWLKHFRPELIDSDVKTVNMDPGFEIKKLNEEFADIFISKPESSINTVEVTNHKPVFCKVRPVPYALVDQVEQQLRDQVKRGTFEGVFNSKWATSIVVVAKPSGKICIKPEIVCDGNPIPKGKDLFEKLGGGLLYTKSDMAEAYLQFEANPQLQKISTLITPVGLLKSRSLSFGINPAPAIFQSKQDELLCGIPGVVNDTTVTEKTNGELLKSLPWVYDVFRENENSDCLSHLPLLKNVISIAKTDSEKVWLGSIESPPNLFLGRELRIILSISKWDLKFKIFESQNRNVSNRAKLAKPRDLDIRDFGKVSFVKGNKAICENGIIMAKRGLTAFDIKLDAMGKVFKRHLKQLILNTAGGISQGDTGSNPIPKPTQPNLNLPSLQSIVGLNLNDAIQQQPVQQLQQRAMRSRDHQFDLVSMTLLHNVANSGSLFFILVSVVSLNKLGGNVEIYILVKCSCTLNV